MHHSTSCENAKGTQCRCTCGGASHNRSVIASITGDHRKAREWATSRRWDQKSSDGQPSGTKPAARGRSTVQAVIAESLIYLLDEGIPADESAALKTLAEAMSDEIGAEITAELATCAEQDRPKHHFWCVVLAAVCKTYDLWIRRVRTDLDAAIDIVVDAVFEIVVAESSSRPNLGKNNTAMRAIGGVSQQKHLAFADDLYRDLLRRILKKAMDAIVNAIDQTNEHLVMKWLRLIGALVCPDPGAHPAVVIYCIWPLILGPFKNAVSADLQNWLSVAIPAPGRKTPVAPQSSMSGHRTLAQTTAS